jgi:hypothetical protein
MLAPTTGKVVPGAIAASTCASSSVNTNALRWM